MKKRMGDVQFVNRWIRLGCVQSNTAYIRCVLHCTTSMEAHEKAAVVMIVKDTYASVIYTVVVVVVLLL